MTNTRIAAVVVTYNRKALVEKCMESILGQQGASCDIIIIDNGSTDNTEELFRTKYSKKGIFYENRGRNYGCADSTGYGIKKAVLAGYDYIWVMDDDVFPFPDALKSLLEADEKLNGEWGCLSGVAYWTDGSICKANRQKKSLFSFVKDREYAEKEYIPVIMVSLASMFLKATVVRDVGLPIAEYYIYTEDYEFCSRISKRYPIYVVTNSKVTHAMRENRKVDFVKEPEDRLYRYRYLYRNDVHCYRKMGWKGKVYLVVKYIYTMIRLLCLERDSKKEKIDIVKKGYMEGRQFNPTIRYV